MDEKRLMWFIKQVDEDLISISTVLELLGLDLRPALKYLYDLEYLGYLQKARIDDHWVVSMRGKVLIQKRTNRKFKVESMKRALIKFLKRVEKVNESNEYTSKVLKVVVTTQYPILETSDGISIKYSLLRLNLEDNERERRENRLRKRKRGTFDNHLELINYPEKAIHTFLKSRSHILKLERLDDDVISALSSFRVYGFDIGRSN